MLIVAIILLKTEHIEEENHVTESEK